MLQNLPRHFDNPDFRADALRGIGKTVERINGLIRSLTLLRQAPEMHRTETNLNAVVSATLDSLAGAGGQPVTRELGELPQLLIDTDQLQKVLTNLVLNAREAIVQEGWIRVATSRENGWAVLTVEDNGCGMSADFLNRSLFRPFQTTKKKGIGIGMFHCKAIVEAHRGRIEVRSEPGKGTVFRVLLPLKEERT
jgi:signal transduction histidine kinase